MSRKHAASPAKGPTQRQLRAGELIRHALAEILAREDLRDPALDGALLTVTEVRPSPDLRSAKVYVAPMGGDDPQAIVAGLNRCASFLRGRLGRGIDMKFTPELRFHADDRYEAASRIEDLLARPEVKRDLDASEEESE